MDTTAFPPTLSPLQAQLSYMEKIFSLSLNPTSLLVDSETMSAISVITSQSEILKRNILLVDKIDNALREKSIGLDCIILCRCTRENIDHIRKEISSPKYNDYIIIFTSAATQEDLEEIAQVDTKEVVKNVYEVYLDYYALDEYLFTVDVPSIIPLLEHPKESKHFRRIADGLTASILSFQKLPMIYFQENSKLCQALAQRVQKDCYDDNERYQYLSASSKKDARNTMLLIMDRRCDPITPLLTQWTYQAMVHENIGQKTGGIHLNRVTIEGTKPEEVVLSAKDDTFFKSNMFSNWGDLCQSVKEIMDEYKVKMNVRDDIKSMDDIRSFIANYPQLKQFSNQVEKHTPLVYALHNSIRDRNLLELSKLEQNIACSNHPKDHFKWLVQLLKDESITKRDKLRLSILYALKYETYNNNANVDQLILLLENECGLKPKEVNLLRMAQKFAGENVQERPQIRFGESGFFNNLKNLHKIVGLSDVENVFTQHKPVLASIIGHILGQGGSAKDTSRFGPFVRVSKPNPGEIHDLIIFVVGGVTYEESLFVHQWNSNPANGGKRVVLGGTSVLNSKAFMKEISHFEKYNLF